MSVEECWIDLDEDGAARTPTQTARDGGIGGRTQVPVAGKTDKVTGQKRKADDKAATKRTPSIASFFQRAPPPATAVASTPEHTSQNQNTTAMEGVTFLETPARRDSPADSARNRPAVDEDAQSTTTTSSSKRAHTTTVNGSVRPKTTSGRKTSGAALAASLLIDRKPAVRKPSFVWTKEQLAILNATKQASATRIPDAATINSLRAQFGIPEPAEGERCRVETFFAPFHKPKKDRLPPQEKKVPGGFMPEQVAVLEEAYSANPYPTKEERAALSMQVLATVSDATVHRVQLWMVARRIVARAAGEQPAHPRLFDDAERAILEAEYAKNPFPNETTIKRLAKALEAKTTAHRSGPRHRIVEWFSNRRQTEGVGSQRTREVFSKSQLDLLEAAYAKNHRPSYAQVEALRKKLELKPLAYAETCRVQQWFANRLRRRIFGKRPAHYEFSAQDREVLAAAFAESMFLTPAKMQELSTQLGLEDTFPVKRWFDLERKRIEAERAQAEGRALEPSGGDGDPEGGSDDGGGAEDDLQVYDDVEIEMVPSGEESREDEGAYGEGVEGEGAEGEYAGGSEAEGDGQGDEDETALPSAKRARLA